MPDALLGHISDPSVLVRSVVAKVEHAETSMAAQLAFSASSQAQPML